MRAFVPIACLGFALGGCARVDPAHTPIAAGDEVTLAEWQRTVASQLPAAQQQEFADALQEIRFRISARQEATGHDAIQAALCKHVDGRTVNEVVLLAADLKLQRLESEQSELQQAVNTNAHLLTRPGDQAGADYLERIRARQQQRLDGIAAEIERAKASIAAHGGTERPHPETATAAAPLEKISREDALKQMAVMLQERRDGGTLKYGAWPVRFDRDGSQLDGAERRSFLARKAALEPAGKIAIAVRIKGHWLTFEGLNQAPELPKFALASLTAEDRKKFEVDWVNVEAELWARKAAVDLEGVNPGGPVLPAGGGVLPSAPALDIGRGPPVPPTSR